ncbi:hypothetical protein OG21DRAFT_1484961 [Imleria badia]|nr:hypothetical protein OG21DRAFT_1484961 [Imleria badia]
MTQTTTQWHHLHTLNLILTCSHSAIHFNVAPYSDPEPTTQASSSTNPSPGDSLMPFRLPFVASSASRMEHTPGGGINWWRMYRFPAIASPNLEQGGPQAVPPLSQPAFCALVQGPSHSSTSPWAHTAEQNQQNEMVTSPPPP